jgi:hypothetical protein
VEHAATRAAPTNRDLLAILMAAWSRDESDFVLCIDGRRAPPSGRASRCLAFALQPQVGCVWPFFDADRRLCYTIAGESRLDQVAAPSNVLSRFSGNVLTGPAQGLLARRGLLEQVTQHTIEGAAPSFLDAPGDVDAACATLGLAARELGYRNVSCGGMRSSVELPEVSVPRDWLPRRDPYV